MPEKCLILETITHFQTVKYAQIQQRMHFGRLIWKRSGDILTSLNYGNSWRRQSFLHTSRALAKNQKLLLLLNTLRLSKEEIMMDEAVQLFEYTDHRYDGDYLAKKSHH